MENSEAENASCPTEMPGPSQEDILLKLASKSRKAFSQLRVKEKKEEQLSSRKRTVSEDTEAEELEDLEYRKYNRYSSRVYCEKGGSQMVAASCTDRWIH